VLALASAAEQFVLPYGQVTAAGQHAGHATSGFGGASGQGGVGGVFDAYRQAPWLHRAIVMPQPPKSQVVPSGRRQSAPPVGAALGQDARSRAALSSPLPASVETSTLMVVHAPPSATEAATTRSAAASDPRTRTREWARADPGGVARASNGGCTA
jgi:hypothetical protein